MRAASPAPPTVGTGAETRHRRRHRRRPLRNSPRRYLVVFLVTAVAGLALVSTGAVVVSGRIARANALADAEQAATRLAQFLVAPIVAEALAGEAGRWAELERRIEDRLRDRSIEAVFIWTEAGEVLYSSDPSTVGTTIAPTPELLTAINGKISSDLAPGSEIRFSGEGTRPLLEVYVPLRVAGRHLAFETYLDSSVVDQMAARLRGRIIPIAVGALLILQLVQVPIAVSLARRARRQDTERAELLARSLTASERERSSIAAEVRAGPVQWLTDIDAGLARLRDQVPAERRSGVDRLINRNPLYFDILMREGLINQLITTDRMNPHPHITVYRPTFYRHVLGMQRDDEFLAWIWRRLRSHWFQLARKEGLIQRPQVRAIFGE